MFLRHGFAVFRSGALWWSFDMTGDFSAPAGKTKMVVDRWPHSVLFGV